MSSSHGLIELNTLEKVKKFVDEIDYCLVDCDGVCYLGNHVSTNCGLR